MSEPVPFQALKASKDSWEFASNRHPKCPHCGEFIKIDDHDLYPLYEEGRHEVDCPECGQEFVVQTNVRHTFSTDEQEVKT